MKSSPSSPIPCSHGDESIIIKTLNSSSSPCESPSSTLDYNAILADSDRPSCRRSNKITESSDRHDHHDHVVRRIVDADDSCAHEPPIDQNQWPEPVQRVQILSESGISTIPPQYIRPLSERPNPNPNSNSQLTQNPNPNPNPNLIQNQNLNPNVNQKLKLSIKRRPASAANPNSNQIPRNSAPSIPILDMAEFRKGGAECIHGHHAFLSELRHACRTWGFFQIVNHGVPTSIMRDMAALSRGFFRLPMSEKQVYSNNPISYEGYGSRVGVRKDAVLDWGDYYFLKVFPTNDRDHSKWPSNPPHWRETMEEYSEKMLEVGKEVLAAMSMSLGLKNERELEERLGDEIDVGLRVNFYPPCPQPDLTLGLSSHSDPGALTLLLPDDQQIVGLQIRAPVSTNEYSTQGQLQGDWVTVQPRPDALIVNLGDQLQILTNGGYKSVEHRVVVNNKHERLSVACFISPTNDTLVAPLPELLESKNNGCTIEPAYIPMTFREYRSFIRKSGTNGKGHLNFVTSPSTTSPKVN